MKNVRMDGQTHRRLITVDQKSSLKLEIRSVVLRAMRHKFRGSPKLKCRPAPALAFFWRLSYFSTRSALSRRTASLRTCAILSDRILVKLLLRQQYAIHHKAVMVKHIRRLVMLNILIKVGLVFSTFQKSVKQLMHCYD